MSLVLSQIVNDHIKVKISNKENPFNTSIGQEVVSVQEGFWARLAREGTLVNKNITIADTGTIMKHADILTPQAGTAVYPKCIHITCSQDSEIEVSITTGFQSSPEVSMSAFVKSGTPLILNFEGEVLLRENADMGINAVIKVGVKSESPGKVWAFMNGVEVTYVD